MEAAPSAQPAPPPGDPPAGTPAAAVAANNDYAQQWQAYYAQKAAYDQQQEQGYGQQLQG